MQRTKQLLPHSSPSYLFGPSLGNQHTKDVSSILSNSPESLVKSWMMTMIKDAAPKDTPSTQIGGRNLVYNHSKLPINNTFVVSNSQYKLEMRQN